MYCNYYISIAIIAFFIVFYYNYCISIAIIALLLYFYCNYCIFTIFTWYTSWPGTTALGMIISSHGIMVLDEGEYKNKFGW